MFSLFTIYEQWPSIKYQSPVCSAAFFYSCACRLLCVLAPLAFAYASGGFWLKMDVGREPADVHFTHDVICVLHTIDNSVENAPLPSYKVWSTYEQFDRLMPSRVAVPFVTSRENDFDGDGRNDRCKLTVDFSIEPHHSVYAFEAFLGFSVGVHSPLSRFTEHWLVSVSAAHNAKAASSAVAVKSLLKLQQRHLLAPHRNIFSSERSSVSGMPAGGVRHDRLQLASIVADIFARNLSAVLDLQFVRWSPSLEPPNKPRHFSLDLTVDFPEQNILFQPGVWRVLKGAWMQYVCVLLVSVFVFERIKRWLFSGNLFSVYISRDRNLQR